MRQCTENGRREFLQGTTLALSGLALWPLASSVQNALVEGRAGPAVSTVVIFQDKAMFSDNEALDAYQPPQNLSHNTRKYVDSIDHQTFLNRHWFI